MSLAFKKRSGCEEKKYENQLLVLGKVNLKTLSLLVFLTSSLL